MAPLLTVELSKKAKPNKRDKNNFSYVFNWERAEIQELFLKQACFIAVGLT